MSISTTSAGDDYRRRFEYFYDVIAGSIQENAAAQAALAKALEEGMIVVSAIVYAELAGRFASREVLNSFLEVWRCRVEPLEVATAHLADIYFKQYRRRGGGRVRILPDFLIGAHADLNADRILTRDKRFFGESFLGLRAVAPIDFA